MKIYPANISKHNSDHEKNHSLMISNGEGLYYLAVKKLSALLRKITSKHLTIFIVDNFYCLIHLDSFRTKNNLQSHKNVCENKDFCGVVIPFKKDIKI